MIIESIMRVQALAPVTKERGKALSFSQNFFVREKNSRKIALTKWWSRAPIAVRLNDQKKGLSALF